MPWEWESTHSDFIAGPAGPGSVGFENPLEVDLRVDPTINRGANVFSTYTGIIILSGLRDAVDPFKPVKQTSASWSRGLLRFTVPTFDRVWVQMPPEGLPARKGPIVDDRPRPQATYLHAGTVALSLASIFNRHGANNAGWAVDGAQIFAVTNQDVGLVVEAKIAIRDSDGFLHRLAYQVTALGQEWPAVSGGLSPT